MGLWDRWIPIRSSEPSVFFFSVNLFFVLLHRADWGAAVVSLFSFFVSIWREEGHFLLSYTRLFDHAQHSTHAQLPTHTHLFLPLWLVCHLLLTVPRFLFKLLRHYTPTQPFFSTALSPPSYDVVCIAWRIA